MNVDYMVQSGTTSGSDSPADINDISRLLATVARPFVAASDRELSVLRRGLTKPGWKRSLYLQEPDLGETMLSGAGLLYVANHWLERDITVPERGGQFHDFFCEDGTLLDFGPLAAPAAEYRCPVCGKTYSGDSCQTAHRWFEHHAMAAGCLALALVYQIDRDAECADKAVEILKEYAAAYPGPHTSRTEGGMLAGSTDEAAWIITLAQAYDLVYHSKSLNNLDRSIIEKNLFVAAAEGLLALEDEGHWAACHNSAAGVVGCAIKNAGLVSAGLSGMLAQLTTDLTPEGLWPQSASHHFHALAMFVQLAEACCRMGTNLYDHRTPSGKKLELMFRAPVAYAYPSFQLPALDDSWYRASLPLGLYEIAFRRWEDPLFAWVLRTGYDFARKPVNKDQADNRLAYARSSLNAFLFGRDLPGRAHSPRMGPTDFPGIGICSLRTESGSTLTFDYGCESAEPSGHRDLMGVTLCANGSVVVPDYGAPGHGAGAHDYYESTASHSTILVDGKSQDPVGESAIEHFYPGIYIQSARAATAAAYPGVRHTRHVMMIGDVVVIKDSLEGVKPHVYDWLLHIEGKPAGLPGAAENIAAACSYFKDARSINGVESQLLTWDGEGSGLAAWFGMDGPGTIVEAAAPAQTIAPTSSVLDLRREGTSASFLAVLVPFAGEAPVIEQAGNCFRITNGDIVDRIFIAGAPGASRGAGEIESDAEIAAVREVGGEMEACGLRNGSFISMKGELVIGGTGRFDWAEVSMDGRNPVINFDGSTGDNLKLRCHARAMKVNGHRISASCLDGVASIRITGLLKER